MAIYCCTTTLLHYLSEKKTIVIKYNLSSAAPCETEKPVFVIYSILLIPTRDIEKKNKCMIFSFFLMTSLSLFVSLFEFVSQMCLHVMYVKTVWATGS